MRYAAEHGSTRVAFASFEPAMHPISFSIAARCHVGPRFRSVDRAPVFSSGFDRHQNRRQPFVSSAARMFKRCGLLLNTSHRVVYWRRSVAQFAIIKPVTYGLLAAWIYVNKTEEVQSGYKGQCLCQI